MKPGLTLEDLIIPDAKISDICFSDDRPTPHRSVRLNIRPDEVEQMFRLGYNPNYDGPLFENAYLNVFLTVWSANIKAHSGKVYLIGSQSGRVVRLGETTLYLAEKVTVLNAKLKIVPDVHTNAYSWEYLVPRISTLAITVPEDELENHGALRDAHIRQDQD